MTQPPSHAASSTTFQSAPLAEIRCLWQAYRKHVLCVLQYACVCVRVCVSWFLSWWHNCISPPESPNVAQRFPAPSSNQGGRWWRWKTLAPVRWGSDDSRRRWTEQIKPENEHERRFWKCDCCAPAVKCQSFIVAQSSLQWFDYKTRW